MRMNVLYKTVLVLLSLIFVVAMGYYVLPMSYMQEVLKDETVHKTEARDDLIGSAYDIESELLELINVLYKNNGVKSLEVDDFLQKTAIEYCMETSEELKEFKEKDLKRIDYPKKFKDVLCFRGIDFKNPYQIINYITNNETMTNILKNGNYKRVGISVISHKDDPGHYKYCLLFGEI